MSVHGSSKMVVISKLVLDQSFSLLSLCEPKYKYGIDSSAYLVYVGVGVGVGVGAWACASSIKNYWISKYCIHTFSS